MKIAQVISTPPFAWATGGAARSVYELSKELVKRGHEVTMLTTDLYEPSKRWVACESPEYIEGIKVLRFRNISDWLAWKHHVSISPSIIKYLRSHLREYDIVHLQDLISLLAIATAKYCRKFDIPYVLTTHGSIPWLNERKPLNWLYNKAWGHDMLWNASKVAALTKTEAEQYKNMGVSEGKIDIVPNGIDLSEYDNLPQRGEFRRKYGLNSEQKIILYLSRIHKIKGPNLLAKAFAALSNDFSDAKLVITGPDDGYLPALERLIKELKIEEKVLFTGALYGREKLQAYVDADVYVLPSSYEIFGITVLEACACGTPVIVTDRCGCNEWIKESCAGYMVKYGDVSGLKEQMIKCLSDDAEAKRTAQQGKEYIRNNLGWAHVTHGIENIYAACINKRK